jgi:RNA polymerase-binding transcription factor DksA
MSETAQVEIHLRMLDCQICGSEINPDREEYIGRTRVCPRCYEHLNKTNRKRRK